VLKRFEQPDEDRPASLLGVAVGAGAFLCPFEGRKTYILLEASAPSGLPYFCLRVRAVPLQSRPSPKRCSSKDDRPPAKVLVLKVRA
jgi:hypothetical protein